MGDLVAVVFLLMFCFGLLTFLVMLVASLFIERVLDGKIALGLLTFAASGATGFAATWRFMVLSKDREEEGTRPANELGDGGPTDPTQGERDFRDQHGYWPMSSDRGQEGRWEP